MKMIYDIYENDLSDLWKWLSDLLKWYKRFNRMTYEFKQNYLKVLLPINEFPRIRMKHFRFPSNFQFPALSEIPPHGIPLRIQAEAPQSTFSCLSCVRKYSPHCYPHGSYANGRLFSVFVHRKSQVEPILPANMHLDQTTVQFSVRFILSLLSAQDLCTSETLDSTLFLFFAKLVEMSKRCIERTINESCLYYW